MVTDIHVRLPCKDDLRRTNRASSETAAKSRAVMLGLDELNQDQAPWDIIREEFGVDREGLRAFLAATNSDYKKELIKSVSLDLLKYIISIKLEDGLVHCHNGEDYFNMC